MEDFIKRIALEKFNLDRKLSKLSKFINSDKFNKLDERAQLDLSEQELSMKGYSARLNTRLSYLVTNPADLQSEVEFGIGELIELCEEGFAIRRSSWIGELANCIIVKQIPADIQEATIPNMQSLPIKAKELIRDTCKELHYRNQLIIINLETGVTSYWYPNSEDLFAKDYIIVE